MKLGRDVVIISKAILDQPTALGQPGLFSHKTLDSNQINLSDYSNFRYFKKKKSYSPFYLKVPH